MREGVGLGKQPELTGGGLLRSLGGWSQVIARRRTGKAEEGDERILGELGLSCAEMARHLGVAASSISRLIEKIAVK